MLYHLEHSSTFLVSCDIAVACSKLSCGQENLSKLLKLHSAIHCLFTVDMGCILNCFMLSLPCFPAFCCSAIPTSRYILVLLMSLFVSSRCMLEQFATYHREAKCLSSQASSVDVHSMGWRITDSGICSCTDSMWIDNAFSMSTLRLHAHWPYF